MFRLIVIKTGCRLTIVMVSLVTNLLLNLSDDAGIVCAAAHYKRVIPMLDLFDEGYFRRWFFLTGFGPHVIHPSTAVFFGNLIHDGKEKLPVGVGKVDQVFTVEFVLDGMHAHNAVLIVNPDIGA